MLADTTSILTDLGYEEGNMNNPGDFVIERAFVER